MTLKEIKEQVMFQSNNDAEDVGDFLPALNDYVNEAYDRLVIIWDHQHVPSDDYPLLENDDDEPDVPEWTHRFLADWATWLVYRNGNPQKQQRGAAYRESFLEMLSKVSGEGGSNGTDENGNLIKYGNFRNIPV